MNIFLIYKFDFIHFIFCIVSFNTLLIILICWFCCILQYWFLFYKLFFNEKLVLLYIYIYIFILWIWIWIHCTDILHYQKILLIYFEMQYQVDLNGKLEKMADSYDGKAVMDLTKWGDGGKLEKMAVNDVTRKTNSELYAKGRRGNAWFFRFVSFLLLFLKSGPLNNCLPHVTDLDKGLEKKEDKQMELISTRILWPGFKPRLPHF
jgi:hypothetical protein